mgnify:FL=1
MFLVHPSLMQEEINLTCNVLTEVMCLAATQRNEFIKLHADNN